MSASFVMSAPRHPLSTPAPGLFVDAGSSALTWVELIHHPGVIERWIRFGAQAGEVILDRRSRFLGFAPGSVFAFVRWAAGDYGTVVSRIDILQALDRCQGCSTVPGVTPGAEILLRLAGWPKVQQVLAAIDTIEGLGLDPVEAAPDHWRHVHHRLAAGQPPRPYTAERHRAWLARRELFS
jgi:Protein of unknown function (DUF2840)